MFATKKRNKSLRIEGAKLSTNKKPNVYLFLPMPQSEKIINELYSSNAWGTYYANRYYFSIKTKRTRLEAGLTKTKAELTQQEQLILQEENLAAFFHEYLHYIQETSTIIGHATMLNNVLMKAIFTNYKSRDISSSESLGAVSDLTHVQEFANAALTNSRLDGSGKLDFLMRKIVDLDLVDEEMHFPAAPLGKQSGIIQMLRVKYSGFYKGRPTTNEITLGRFYLYESLAYEMDQILEKRAKKLKKISDPHIGTEYTVCRMVAQHVFPLIQQEIAMAAALLALQHIDAGNAFLIILNRLAKGCSNGIGQDEIIAQVKSEVSKTLKVQRNSFFAQQDVYIELFKDRVGLETSYTYIAGVNKSLYDLRISNPCFELDWMLKGQYDLILDHAQMCDYLYIFKDPETHTNDPEFFRDFMATSLPEEISQALKVLIAFDHYFFVHKGMATFRVEQNPKSSHQCPFFTCCDLSERSDHINICRTKPWRIYEIFQPQRKHCWYSLGVLESKATTRQ